MQRRFGNRISFESLEQRLALAAHMVADATTAALPLVTRDLTEYRGELYFATSSNSFSAGDFAAEVWKTDGTGEGTVLVHEFAATPRSVGESNQVNSSWATAIERVGDELLIAVETTWPGGTDTEELIELFVSDGTSEGTTKVKTVLDNWPFGSGFTDGTVVEDKLYFTIPQFTSALWVSDGTPDGTRELNDPIGSGSGDDYLIAGPNGDLYFSRNESEHGSELWRSDGTLEGTVLAVDVEPGEGSSFPHNLLTLGGQVLFVTLPQSNSDIQRLSAFDPGTGAVSVLTQMPRTFDSSVALVGDAVYFTSPSDAGIGTQVWRTDGTIAGTQSLYSTTAIITEIFEAGGSVVAFAQDEAGLQFVSVDDGQPPLALLSTDSSSVIGSKVATDQGVYFTVDQGDDSTLWVSDGTPQGTAQVLDVRSMASPLSVLNGRATFLALDGTTTEVWQTDGTVEGTTHQPIVRSEHTGSSIIREIVNVDGTAFYTVQHGARDRHMEGEGPYSAELWKSDGSPEGTARVTNHIFTFPGQLDYALPSFVAIDGGLIFTAFSAPWGDAEVWFSDGTMEGTRIISEEEIGELAPTVELSNDEERHVLESRSPHQRYVTWDNVFVWEPNLAEDPTTGRINNRFQSSVDADDLTYFVRSDDEYGTELWQRDAEGEEAVHDLNPGPNGSFPRNLRLIDDTLFFTANDGVHGFEMWTLEQDDSQLQGAELFAQFLVLSDNFGQRTEFGSAAGDYDGDGQVGFSDFLILSARFEGVPLPAS